MLNTQKIIIQTTKAEQVNQYNYFSKIQISSFDEESEITNSQMTDGVFDRTLKNKL